VLASCASYGPYHGNSASAPSNSIRGPADGRYKFAFIEFGDQGSELDPSQRAAALDVIRRAPRPFLLVYIHGWQNNANSGDVCRFEHFIDTLSTYPEAVGRKVNVIGVYIAWRGKDVTLPVAKFLTFWNRKSPRLTAAWRRSASSPWPRVRPIKRFIIACCSAILLEDWCWRTHFLILFSM